MKKLLYIFIAIILLGTGGYYFLNNSKSQDVKYRTEKLSRGDITIQVRATGTINPKRTVLVGSQVSGTIAKLFVDFNSVVKKGEIIAIIDSTFLYASVKEAQANLERTNAQVNQFQRTLTRTDELFKKELVSKADYDAALTDYESALAQQKQTQAALDRAMVNLRFSVIRAPIDGIIVSRAVDVGQTVAASLQAPTIFSIANDLKLMQVEASVDEADIGQIQDGQSVTFSVDSYPDEKFTGTVTQVRIAPVTVQNVVTYTVIIEVPNEQLKLRPGMTATVSILVQQKENILRVPALALRFQPPADAIDNTPDQKDTASMKNGGGDQWKRRDTSATKNEDNQRWKHRDSTARTGEDGKRKEFSPEQMQEWKERREGGGGERKMMKRNIGKVWVLLNGKDLKQVRVRTGITDNRYVEVFSDELKEGDDIIIGQTGGDPTAQNNQTQNPFAPKMPGGGGGGGGGGRRGF